LGKTLKRGMGWSFASDHLGEQVMREIVALVLARFEELCADRQPSAR
jgi:hypothetical protein